MASIGDNGFNSDLESNVSATAADVGKRRDGELGLDAVCLSWSCRVQKFEVDRSRGIVRLSQLACFGFPPRLSRL